MPPLRTVFAVLVVAYGVGRFGLATYSGTIFLHGDFSPTVHDAIPQTTGADYSALPTFLRGPTQYLTILPLTYADSYESAAQLLLPVYGLLIGGIAFLAWRAAADATPGAVGWWPVAAATLGYPPLLEAYVGREFEVVIVAAFALLMWAAVHDRLAVVGALAAYGAFYKYIPFVMLPYLLARGWWRALAAFAAAALVILLLAQGLFGLDRFVNNSIPAKAWGLVAGNATTDDFCSQVLIIDGGGDTDDTGVRNDACRLSALTSIPAPLIYGGIVFGTLGVFAVGFRRHLRRPSPLSPDDERWRRILELGLLFVVMAAFVYSHYYYLSLLVLPLNALLVRFLSEPRRFRRHLVIWGISYVMLGALLAQPQLTERWVGINPMELTTTFYGTLIGELLLVGLILQQYLTLPSSDSPAGAMDAGPRISADGRHI